MPAPYTKPHPIVIRAASRESGLLRAAQHGWPAFLGIFGSDLRAQARLYYDALESAGHPEHVVETCRRWSCCDWLSVTLGETDADALARERAAQAEQMALRSRYIERFGKIDGPVIKPTPGKSTAEAYARGEDMKDTVAGSPDTVAAKVRQLQEAGINHVHLRFLGEWAGETREICESSARLFAQEVMPRFSDVPMSLRATP
jgi:alkanesulfonate monooxygenase SsuD/methylene tetrahydromethanopterin reductase-like flavin-dependent oxidoreductase (luciferase family)